jgi:hypothetical protein
VTGIKVGQGYAWQNNSAYVGSTTLCFTEFIAYVLPPLGTIFTEGNHMGTCGAVVQNVVPAGPDKSATVLAGGGNGNIVAGTGAFKGVSGTYIDRVFVDLPATGSYYYDGLFFNLMLAPPRGF